MKLAAFLEACYYNLYACLTLTPATGYPRWTTTMSPWTSSSSLPSGVMCLHAGWLATVPAFAEDALAHEPRLHTSRAAHVRNPGTQQVSLIVCFKPVCPRVHTPAPR